MRSKCPRARAKYRTVATSVVTVTRVREKAHLASGARELLDLLAFERPAMAPNPAPVLSLLFVYLCSFTQAIRMFLCPSEPSVPLPECPGCPGCPGHVGYGQLHTSSDRNRTFRHAPRQGAAQWTPARLQDPRRFPFSTLQISTSQSMELMELMELMCSWSLSQQFQRPA